jgi:hypothetical protein
MSCARSPIVTSDKEPLMAERRHNFDLILSHGAEGIIFMILATIGLTYTVAITAKIGHYNVEFFCQRLGEPVPASMCLWIAVKQQQRGAIATVADEDVCALRSNPPGFETLEQARIRRQRACGGSRGDGLPKQLFGR